MQLDPFLAVFAAGHPSAGQVITRPALCGVCAKAFTQSLLSARFLAAVEKRGDSAMRLLARQIPDYYVPVYCPVCERAALGHEARKVERWEAA